MYHSHLHPKRVKDRHYQRASNTEKHHNHSPTREPKTGIFSKLEIQKGATATHRLESQGQDCQQARITARHDSYSLTEEPRTCLSVGYKHSKALQSLTNWRTGIVSWLQIQIATTATHILERQGQSFLAG